MSAEPKTFASKSQNTEEWLQERRKYMGSSDAPAALGMSRYCSPQDIAAAKKDSLTSEYQPQEETPAMKRGHVLEPVVARLYEEITGRSVDICPSVIHHAHGWMAASPDRYIQNQNGLLEIKTHTSWMRDQYGEHGSSEITDYEYVQVQHQMAVTGVDFVDVCVIFADNQALQILSDMLDSGNVTLEFAVTLAKQMECAIFPISRDDEFISTLIEAEQEFWTRYIEGDEVPVDIQTMQPVSGIRASTLQEDEKALELKDVWIESKRIEDRHNELKAAIQDAIQDAEGIDTIAGKITWKKNKDTLGDVTDWELVSKKIATKAMADGSLSKHEYDEIYNSCTENKIVRRGSRVFRVPAAWKKEL